jgi:AraC-like DNA-binding protein
MVQGKTFKSWGWLHFLPFVVAFSYLIGRFIHSAWLAYALLNNETRLVLQIMSILIYHSLALQILKQFRSNINLNMIELQKLRFQWLNSFVIISLVVCVAISSANFLMVMYHPVLSPVRFGFVIFTAFIYWISYSALKQPQIFDVIIGADKDVMIGNVVPRMIVHKPVKKYANSRMSKEEVDRIVNMLQTIIQIEKVYLDPEITIDRIAELIPCSRHHLSQVLNEQMKQSFYDYINTYRVKEAQLLLLDHQRAEHKIASIAYDAGFNSISAFNDVFRKLTGLTPSQYRKQACEPSMQQRV